MPVVDRPPTVTHTDPSSITSPTMAIRGLPAGASIELGSDIDWPPKIQAALRSAIGRPVTGNVTSERNRRVWKTDLSEQITMLWKGKPVNRQNSNFPKN